VSDNEGGESAAGTLHSTSSPLPPEVQELWEATAPWWQENFTEGADPEYTEQIIPLVSELLEVAGPRSVLDIGCGEGQLSRIAAGVTGVERVIGLDPTWAQLTAARERGGPPGRTATATAQAGAVGLVRGEAGALCFPAGCFDAALACLVFEHIEDAAGALREVGRVLRPGGVLLMFLNHPLLQAPGSGWVDDHILGEQYWRIGPYLAENHDVEEVDKDVWIPFVHRPLSVYVNALIAAGLYLTAMVEPAPPEGFLRRADEYREAADYPRLLVLRAEKFSPGGIAGRPGDGAAQ
jgi:SAM-dependent methyltransferase